MSNIDTTVHLTSSLKWKTQKTSFCEKTNIDGMNTYYTDSYNYLIKSYFTVCKDCIQSEEFGLELLRVYT